MWNNLSKGARAYIVVLAKGNTVSSDEAFTVSVSLTWNAIDAGGNFLNKKGKVVFGETSWIGSR